MNRNQLNSKTSLFILYHITTNLSQRHFTSWPGACCTKLVILAKLICGLVAQTSDGEKWETMWHKLPWIYILWSSAAAHKAKLQDLMNLIPYQSRYNQGECYNCVLVCMLRSPLRGCSPRSRTGLTALDRTEWFQGGGVANHTHCLHGCDCWWKFLKIRAFFSGFNERKKNL